MHDKQNDLNRLTDQCVRFRDKNLAFTDITIDDVTNFCVSQAMKTIQRRTQKYDFSTPVTLYILELYRKMLQRNTGSNSLRPLKRREITPNMSRYDALTELYISLANDSPAFLIQHRTFLLLVEEALERHLPYWDIRIDQNMSDPKTSIIWTPEYFGDGLGTVVTGQFSNWMSRNGLPLSREIGKIGTLFSQEHFDHIMSLQNHYDILEPNKFPQNSLEFLSTGTKLWVKGLSTSADRFTLDPVVIMIDAFIDYVWESFWKQLEVNSIDPRDDYEGQNDLDLDIFEKNVLYNHRDMYDHSLPCKSCDTNIENVCKEAKCQVKDNVLLPTKKTTKTHETTFHIGTKNHRVKRNTNNVLNWDAIYDFFNRLRSSRLVMRNRLTGPQRARAAIAAIGPLPIGQRFTSPFTDPRTRGDPLPTGPLRSRLRRGFYPVPRPRGGTQNVLDYKQKIRNQNVGAQFKSILTDVRTKVNPLLIKTFKPGANQIKHEGINDFQMKHKTAQGK
ncbi:uncharacterized protein LOC132554974 [Ylistrum balloti]|uniref:uncharacterized protein LOC132554974 n=1 Tax=Ylistrum balloti TaxID=509963 RepID=UPI002905A657|nr:uncharacterized protein LOC132554974 [Ylistrum balloti]